jgi:hypothetical protein
MGGEVGGRGAGSARRWHSCCGELMIWLGDSKLSTRDRKDPARLAAKLPAKSRLAAIAARLDSDHSPTNRISQFPPIPLSPSQHSFTFI